MNRPLMTLVLAATCAGVVIAAQKEWSFPNTKPNGRATVEYRHEGLHIVANYDYSQRNHKTSWLLIDLAAASTRRFVLHKADVKLLTPNGRELSVAPQQALLGDSSGITFVLQNAQIFRRQLDSYFTQRETSDPIKFQIAPGQGTTSDEAIVDNDRVAKGAIFFRTPEGSWDAGTYRLEVDTDVAKAALPIALQ